jgi:hypothetical protein
LARPPPRAQSGARNVGFWRVKLGTLKKIRAGSVQKQKISANPKKISGRQVALLRKFPISRMSKFMKNSRRDYEIRNEDFDSLFLGKCFGN